MWQADAAFWSKTSPILFPIVGALKENAYSYQGQIYSLPRHGFARELEFEVKDFAENWIEFVLKSGDETLHMFPFAFELTVRYELLGNGLRCSYSVYNPDWDSLLYFSLGGHPAFNIQVGEDIAYADYRLIFPDDDHLNVYKLQNNLITKPGQQYRLTANSLPLSYELFYDDALVLMDIKTTNVILANNRNNERLHFKFRGFSYFGIWAAKDANFICLEPWAGIADDEDHDQHLVNKTGIMSLSPRETWEANWEVELAFIPLDC